MTVSASWPDLKPCGPRLEAGSWKLEAGSVVFLYVPVLSAEFRFRREKGEVEIRDDEFSCGDTQV